MRKYFLITMVGLAGNSIYAQQSENVYSFGSTKDVYYNMPVGSLKTSNATDWDLAFATSPMDVSVIANSVKGIEVYVASETVADWATLDTTGMTWKRLFNSETSWASGAFCNMGTAHPDYGWGLYNQTTHNVSAKRIFVLKFADGSYKKMIIDRATTDGNFDFRIANLDGSSLVSKAFIKSTYNSRNFIHYNISGDNFIEYEAVSADWHLLFTKYHSEVPQGPGKAWYPVSGVKSNIGVLVAQRDGVPVTNKDTLGLGYVAAINEIGSDWKTFNNTTLTYDIVANRTYFVKLKNGDIWTLYFTGFEGGASGIYYFTKERIAHNVSVEPFPENKMTVYPNPSSSNVSVLTEINSKGWIMSLRNMNGVVVKEMTGSKTGFIDVSFDVSNLNKGVYFIELKDENNRFLSKLIVK